MRLGIACKNVCCIIRKPTAARVCCLIVLVSGVFSYGAAPELFVSRTGALFFTASDLTTNGVFGLSNAVAAVVSQVPAPSTKGGTIAIVNTQVWARFYDNE